MSFDQLRTQIQRTLKDTASFYKIDLHVHTKDSYDFAKKDKPASQKDLDSQPTDFVEHALQNEIQMVSITDHNRCGYAFQVMKAAEDFRKSGQDKYRFNNLTVLPGCEISLDYNGRTVHILSIFPEETSEHEIENIFDGTGIDPNPADRTKDSKVTLIKLKALLEKIRKKNGVCIAAHINETNGLREEIKKLNEGQILKLEKKQRELREQGKHSEANHLEHEITKAKQKAESQFQEEIFIDSLFDAVEFKKPDERQHFENVEIENKNYTKACVINSDAHYLDEIGMKTNITRIKMDKPGYNGLKRAFQDPKTRIKFEEELPQTDIKKILGIRIDKGFLDGQMIGFTGNLNCLIGGRGTGKTSLLEIIRFLMEETIPDFRKQDVDSLMRKVFEGAMATMIFQDENRNEYVLQRSTDQEHTFCYDLTGAPIEDISIKDSQIINVDIYGWSEIETIARDPKEQLDLIDKFIEGIEDLKTKEKNIISNLKSNATQILDLMRKKEEQLPIVSTLPEKKAELEKLKTEKLDEAEIKSQQITNESSLLSSMLDTITSLRAKIEGLDLKNQVESFFISVKEDIDSKDLHNREWFINLYSKLQPYKNKIITTYDNLVEHFDQMLKVVKDDVPRLASKHEEISKQFQALIESVDQTDARAAIQRRQALYNDVQTMELKKKSIDQMEEAVQELLKTRMENLIFSLRETRKEIFELRNEQISNLQEQLNRIAIDIEITVKVVKSGNKEAFKRDLEESCLRKIPLKYKDRKIADTICAKFTPLEFVDTIYKKDASSFIFRSKKQDKFSIDVNDAQIILNHFLSTDKTRIEKSKVLFELEVLDNPDLPQLFLKDGEKSRLIQELSPGQRCTALLPIILLESKNPLIIDQPEDNLDNRLVFNLIVNTIRDLKEKRQILVATHNPNIPVSGDAEQILVFDSDGDRGYIGVRGCIDNEKIIRKVEEIMEGGEKAFLIRAQKYGITPEDLGQPIM